MANFTLEEFTHETTQKILKLKRDDVCYYEDFIQEVKADTNLRPELGDLWATLKNVANRQMVPQKKYKREKIGDKLPYQVYAVKSRHLRLYLFTDDNGMIIIIGGKKTEQDEDLNRCKIITKEYAEFKIKEKRNAQ